jgi:hypothetical protein
MWRAPKPFVKPTWGSNYAEMQKELGLGATPDFQHWRGWEGHARSLGIRLGRRTIIYLHDPTSKTNHKWVSSHSGTHSVLGQAMGNLDSLDSPRPGLGGNHHLPPYSILCSFSPKLHPNGILPRDSQSWVPKLSQFTLLGLWASITSYSDLWLGWNLKKSCNSLQDLCNAMSHTICRCRDQVNSRLLVARSQTGSLTPGPSFSHNLGCKCPNGSSKAILDIYTSRPFQWHQKHPNARCCDPWNRALGFWESWRTPTSHFWECEFHPHTYPKVGLRQYGWRHMKHI